MARDQVDFGDMGLTRAQDNAVREVLSQWDAQRRRLAQSRMRLAAAAGGERRVIRFRDGEGAVVSMMIDPYSYHYWGQRLGYACWGDAQFCREYWRDNPESRVKSVSSNPTVLNLGIPAKLPKFRKTYATEAAA